MTSRQQHWQAVYRDRDPEQVSWYQENPERSAQLIESAGLPPSGRIIDVGGGASRLVDRLMDAGYSDLTVLDLSAVALAYAGERLGARAGEVTWIEADVINHQFERGFDLWHDRAVFHFLCEAGERQAYVDQVRATVAPGGHVILATFGLDGPEQCSGLPIERYGPESLRGALGPDFGAIAFEEEVHRTPAGGSQHFLYGHFRRRPPAG
jgi:SAM-dependent methyltransferase